MSSVWSSRSVSIRALESPQRGARWINRTFYCHYQYYCWAHVPFLWSFERDSSSFLWATHEVFHFLQCGLPGVFLVSGSQTKFPFRAVALSDILRQSGPTAPGLLLCAAISSTHLLTAGCLQAWRVAKHFWEYPKIPLRSNRFCIVWWGAIHPRTFENWLFLSLIFT